jgi:hypothetical protein
MATVAKDFKVKNGLIVEGATGTINGSNILTEASTEFLQDTIGSMVDGGTQTNISVTYNDTTGKLNFVAENGVADSTTDNLVEGSTNKYFTDERAQDAVGNAVGTGLSYNDTTGAIGIDSTVTTNSGSQTLTNKTIDGGSNTLSNIGNGSLSNSAITINGVSTSLGGTRTLGTDDISEGSTNKYFTDERAQDAIGTAIANGTQTNITVTYDDATNSLSFNASGGVGSLSGTANEVEVSNVGTAYTIGLPNDVTLAGNLTINGTPSAGSHAVTKQYVDDIAQGLHIHEACVAATTGNVNIATDLENGDVVDGVTLATGNRVLVKSQTNAAQNGIYVVQASGAALRAADFNEPQEVDGGDFIFITGGTLYDNTGWVQTSTGVVTIGTDPILFTQFSGAGTYLAGNGLSLTGNTFAIDTATTVDVSTAQTLTNKTLTSPTVSGLYLSDNNIVIEGTTDTHETTLTFTDPTQDNTITFKNATGTVAFTSDIPTNTDGLSEGSTNLYYTAARAKEEAANLLTNATKTNIVITKDGSNNLTITAENGVADSTTDNLAEGSTNLYFTTERAEDAVGGMVTGNTETGISVTYDDNTGKLNFSVDDQFPSKSTTNLAEGTNLYFTDARAISALENVVPNFTSIDINSVATQVAARTSVATASQVTAYSFAKANYRSAKFLVKAQTATHTEVSEVLVTLDSSDNVAITEYAMVGTNGNLVDVTADVSGNDVRLRVTTINNNTDVTVVGTLIAATTI